MPDFAHLHLHTEYSLLDGACRIPPLLDHIQALGMKACAITDHGAMYGVIDFYAEALQRGIHPIIGCEVYTCANMDDKQSAMRDYNHLVLLCENNIGYQNLTRLVSAGWTRGFYYKPRIDFELLEKHSEGLIALSACISGEIPSLLLEGRAKDAEQAALRMKRLFGPDRFYIEIQDHGMEEQRRVLPLLVQLAGRLDIPLVATNDAHYLRREDAQAQEVLMCIQTGKTLEDENRMRMTTEELFVKSPGEMAALFPQWPEAIENTNKIAERCWVKFDFNTIHLPNYPIKSGETPEAMLRRLCREGLETRYRPVTEEVEQRLDYELSIITQMGYVDYFLIVWDFIRYAREKHIMVGPGRGSSAGSIVAYSLGITGVDPLKHQLLFERFLNPERISMPDIDIDFCYVRRQQVIDYVAERYGEDHVSQIITFGTMKAKAVVRDVGRVLGYTYAEVDAIAKMVPFALDMTLSKALSVNPELARRYEEDARVRRLFDIAQVLEGMPRHASTHAAGVLITKNPVTEYVPLQTNDDVITTQYPMGIIEKLGLLKMDFLGLRTLTVIRDTLDMLSEEGVHIDLADIPMEDTAVFQMISEGDTDGIFQFESGGMRNFLVNMKPNAFEDIYNAGALYRPGPMDSIPRFIQGKQDPSTIRYLHPLLEPILGVTYGCMVYQEQVMQIVRDLAGYSYGRSDLMRRAMAKKKKDVMAQEREYFIHGLVKDGEIVVPGAIRRGVPEEIAVRIFEEMSTFASYAFPKPHAVAYGIISMQTGWLKRHYPVEFMAATMNSMMDNTDKIAGYIQYCRKHGIPLLPPDINRSTRRFRVDTDDTGRPGIRFGLAAVKNAGHGAVEAVMRKREEGGPYKSLYDFIHRNDTEQVNKRMLESLIRAGAFDRLGANRAQLLATYEKALDNAAQTRKKNVAGQLSLFGEVIDEAPPAYPMLPELPTLKLLEMEKEVTGVYITGHPLDAYRDVLEQLDCSTKFIEELTEREDQGLSMDGLRVKMGGMLTGLRTKATKSGNLMAFVILEDLTGVAEGLVFPKVYEKIQYDLTVDQPILLTGRLSVREDEAPKLLVDTAAPLTIGPLAAQPVSAAYQPPLPMQRLHLRVRDEAQMESLSEAIGAYPGETPLCFHIVKGKKTLLAPHTWNCTLSETLLQTLSNMIGEDNLKIKPL